ncbi:conserved hypothetical protein [Paracidovorax citrulli AAC00-1]|uniref:Transmembrane protein n=2 Tax=Paracidovorax citrulli TaxID=80869 RepID=A1TQB6_PARC0|nr:conserved hypothetical protein [Paracidovorax citrulli AAC00-1]
MKPIGRATRKKRKSSTHDGPSLIAESPMFTKNALVFLHLLAMAVAIAKMLEYDFRFLGMVHRPVTVERRDELRRTKATMTAALWLLWATGLLFVYIGYAQDPAYVMNEKLWMKILAVSVLTLNGMLMHRFAFPLMMQGGVFLELPLGRMLGLTLFAAVSSVSWLYASFLGIARSWNHVMPFQHALAIYLGLLLLAACGSMALMATLRHLYQRAPEAFALPVRTWKKDTSSSTT